MKSFLLVLVVALLSVSVTAQSAAGPVAAPAPAAPAPAPIALYDGPCSTLEVSAAPVLQKLKEKVLLESSTSSSAMLPGPGQACGPAAGNGVCTARREWCKGTIAPGFCAGSALCCQRGGININIPRPVIAADNTRVVNPRIPPQIAPRPTGSRLPLGPAWVRQFPGSNSISDLNNDFRPKAAAFIAALRAAGATVTIAATNRPIERSYLMYNAWRLAKGAVAANAIPAYPGVNIDWTAGGNAAQARTLARSMCAAYGMNWASPRQKVAPQGRSRHNFAAAVDMNIQGYIGKRIAGPAGKPAVVVRNWAGLVALGAQYGVRYYPGENMHWSDTGR